MALRKGADVTTITTTRADYKQVVDRLSKRNISINIS
jgi:hypothetical protein